MYYFSEIHFFSRDVFGDRLFLILGVFWMHFGSQHAIKMGSKIDQTFDGFLDRSWKGFGAPKGHRATLSGNPSLRGGANALGLQNPERGSALVRLSGLKGLPWLGLAFRGLSGLAWLGLLSQNGHGA